MHRSYGRRGALLYLTKEFVILSVRMSLKPLLASLRCIQTSLEFLSFQDSIILILLATQFYLTPMESSIMFFNAFSKLLSEMGFDMSIFTLMNAVGRSSQWLYCPTNKWMKMRPRLLLSVCKRSLYKWKMLTMIKSM